ncbi:hypothetical protein BDY19DRAFT_961421 [Irpex rosettiformis]|uniref:Uncharacterized protein n=1 Tax=Irpex rosettiformis TaxID=378272 RepID=A0ACB8TW97_9APHY|nr:hypothetical protein BDY19DRAFT_961421 [Irpex rosettiformis]
MLAIDCQICKDALGGDKLPVTMPCGHMYCLDCATFWFNSGDNKKCFCGKVFTGDQIIRLWTSNDDLGADAHLGYTHDREELMDVCETSLTGEAIMDPSGKDSAVVSALQRVQNFVEASTRGSDEAGIKNLLKDVRYVLSGIKSVRPLFLPSSFQSYNPILFYFSESREEYHSATTSPLTMGRDRKKDKRAQHDR